MECRNREIEAEARQMFNHICLVADREVMRLVGLHEDALDYYWRVRDMGGKEICWSAVGPCVSLKDIYPRYSAIEAQFEHNGSLPVPEFLFTKAGYEENAKMYGKRTADDWQKFECSTTTKTTGSL